MIDDAKFKQGAIWIGSILAAILAEAILARLAQRCLPGLFSNQQQQTQRPQQLLRRRR
jgi:hypothetical protein